MSKLHDTMKQRGFPVEGFSDKQLRKMAEVAGVTIPEEDRSVQIVERMGRGGKVNKHVVSSPIPIQTASGISYVDGLDVRLEAFAQLVEDVKAAQEQLKKVS